MPGSRQYASFHSEVSRMDITYVVRRCRRSLQIVLNKLRPGLFMVRGGLKDRARPAARVLDPAPPCCLCPALRPSWPLRTNPAAPLSSRLAPRPWSISAIAAVSAPCPGWGSWWISSCLSGRWISRRCHWIPRSWRCCPFEGFGGCGPFSEDLASALAAVLTLRKSSP